MAMDWASETDPEETIFLETKQSESARAKLIFAYKIRRKVDPNIYVYTYTECV